MGLMQIVKKKGPRALRGKRQAGVRRAASSLRPRRVPTLGCSGFVSHCLCAAPRAAVRCSTRYLVNKTLRETIRFQLYNYQTFSFRTFMNLLTCFGLYCDTSVKTVANMDLSCGENIQSSGSSGDGRQADRCVAGADRALDRDPRLLPNLLTLERAHALHTDYFQNVQIDVQPFMRKVVTTWMLEVCEEQQCEEQVFPLAVSYMDRFLAQRAISRQQLQLLAVTAMLLASKFRQCHPLSVDLLCAYTDNSVHPDEVRQWEVMLLQRLNWQLSIATAFDFVEPFLARVPWGRSNPLVRTHALTLTSVCYTETEFLLVPPSLIAAACITAAARGLRVRMCVSELCALTRAPAAAAELVARHVERVLARETQPQEPRPRHAAPAKQTPSDQTQLATTPTDVQDVRF